MTIAQREAQHFFHTYKRLPLEIVHGKGMYLYANDGTRYLDLFAGLAVNALGNSHPRIVKAIHDQCQKYIHLSNYYLQEPQIHLAELLTKYSGYQKVFFCNSGTEAMEGAMKLARKWGSTRGKNHIVSFANSFHGRSMGALSLMDREKYRKGFEPFLPHCHVAAFNNPKALQDSVNDQTLALVLEFIQGEGGVRPLTQELAQSISDLKREHGFLLIADEIQSGIGRTGKFFGFQHYGLHPDVVVVAKPIGGGLPLGAILSSSAVADVFEPGMHGTTFGGNPVACAAGIEVLDEIMEHNLMDNAAKIGKLFFQKLSVLKQKYPAIIRDVRGFGLMIGVELHRDAEAIVNAMRDKKILINGTDQTVLRFLPPLIISEIHVNDTVAVLDQVFQSLI